MTAQNFERTISKDNAGQQIKYYEALVEEISVRNHKGLRLCQALKREKVEVGPYPKVTIFEAANRIMSDLVILYGVKWLLDNSVFPFEKYKVEYGNEDQNGFDICADGNGKKLIGEAFNVAESFFQTKKTSMLKKLRKASADYKIIMFNHDAVGQGYIPKRGGTEFFVFVTVGKKDGEVCSMVPMLQLSGGAETGR
jgi:hypothetical protein